jgi:hypothetical protein
MKLSLQHFNFILYHPADFFYPVKNRVALFKLNNVINSCGNKSGPGKRE